MLHTLYTLRFDAGTPKYISVYNDHFRNSSAHTGAVLSSQPISSSSIEMYFEVTIEEFSGSQLCLGFATAEHDCFQLPGDKAGVGFRSDGKILDGNGLIGADWAGCTPWGTIGDVIGLGINIVTGEVYCTKNGSFLCIIFKHVFQDYFNEDEPLYPVVAMSGKGCVTINFGNRPFRFQFEDRLKSLKDTREEQRRSVLVTEETVEQLVKDYLLYRGFGKTYDIMLEASITPNSKKEKVLCTKSRGSFGVKTAGKMSYIFAYTILL